MEQLQEFYPNSKNVALVSKLVKAHGVDVCRQQISRNWIDESMTFSSFGFTYMTPKTQSGRRSIKNKTDNVVKLVSDLWK